LQAQGSESRYLIIARLRGRHWSAVITYLQQTIRLISFRLITVRRPRLDQSRVNVDFPLWMVEQLDPVASRRVSGAWVFRGSRIPVAALFENLEDGVSQAEFVKLFPGATQEQARLVLEHAARSAAAAQDSTGERSHPGHHCLDRNWRP
jgi:uncharacterized protein (DUF433 family)